MTALQPVAGFELTGTSGDRPADDAVWLPAAVPGGVHEALVAARLLDHPFVDEHEAAAAWVEQRTWWYRATLGPVEAQEGEQVVLRFEGLDGVATAWLDDVELGTHANQHRPASFDVTALLGSGTCALLVRFSPPLAGVLRPGELDERLDQLRAQLQRLRPLAAPPDRDALELRLQRTRRRKAACSWGWDLGPRLPSIGLHRPVLLERRRDARLTGVHARTVQLDTAACTAVLRVTVDVDPAGCTDDCVVRIALTGPDGDVVRTTTRPAAARRDVELALQDVRAWWTHDLGEQPLYALTTQLLRGDEVLDERSERLGLRTIELDRSPDPDEPGRLFRLVLNGVPLFVRGANWVPASLLVGSVPEQRYRDLVEAARHAQMTALRVWGGGLYEHDAFYDACDERGVLVWQDFMFACDDYPSDDVELTAEVRAEAVFQVRRLRNRPCLALWAGNNEVQGIHELTQGGLAPGPWGWWWFHELLPEVVAEHSPGAVYWPGSPWGEDPTEIVNGVRDGDRHAWEVWHGIDVGAGTPQEYASHGEAVHFRRYEHDTGRFISEFGIHAAPEVATLQRWTSPGSLALGSSALEHRNKDTPQDKGWAMMAVETGLPTTLAEYVDRTMACQAEGLKLGVEHYRRRQPHCSGTLVWQLNDVWPGLSWSVLDHDLVGKAGYFFLQRAYRPVLASFAVRSDRLELWVTHSGRQCVDLDLQVRVGGFTGSAAPERLRVRAEPGSSAVVWTGDLPAPDALAEVVDLSGHAAANRRFFAPLKDLPLTGRVRGTARATGPTSAEVLLTATGYAYLARVHAGVPGVRISSGYLDLRDGAEHVVRLDGLPAGTDLGGLTVASYGQEPVVVQTA